MLNWLKARVSTCIVAVMSDNARDHILELGRQLERLLESSSEDDIRTFLTDLGVLKGEVARLLLDERTEGQKLH